MIQNLVDCPHNLGYAGRLSFYFNEETAVGKVVYKNLGFLGYPDYQVGDDGSVWHWIKGSRRKLESVDIEKIREMWASRCFTQDVIAAKFGISPCNISHIVNNRTWRNLEKWRQVKGDPDEYGHTHVWLGHPGKRRKRWTIHTLVLTAFVGPRPQGMHVLHNNGNVKDNHLENLRWGSPTPKTFSPVFTSERIKIHPDGTKERWRDVCRYEGLYRVSDWGRVRSLERKARIGGGSYRHVRARLLKFAYMKPKQKERSYLVVNLSNGDQQEIFLIHRIVLEVFIGPCPKGMEACHNDGNPNNNRLDNLRWDTSRANADDCVGHGTRSNIQGENHYNSKLTEAKVIRIRKLWSTGKYLQQELASMFNVKLVTIHKVVRRKTWAHI